MSGRATSNTIGALQRTLPTRRQRGAGAAPYTIGATNDELAALANDEAALLALLARGRAGLDGAFEPLARVYQDRLFAFALRLCGNRPDAQEVAQDAFVRAYQALASYPPERILALRLRPWLYQITLNVWRNNARSRARHHPPTDSLDQPPSEDRAPYEPADDDASAQPEQAFAQAEQRAELAALVAALPSRYRAAVILRYIEGLSYAEMSQTLEQPIGTIKANVHRGIAQLRAALVPALTTTHTTTLGTPLAPANQPPCGAQHMREEALPCL